LRRFDPTELMNVGGKLPLEGPLEEALVVYGIRLALYLTVIIANFALLGLALFVARVPALLLLLVLVTGILIVFVYSRLKAHVAEKPFPFLEVGGGIVLGLLVAVGFATLVPDSFQDSLVPPRKPIQLPPDDLTPPVVVLVTPVNTATATPTGTPTPPPDTPTPTATATPTPAPTSTATATVTPEPPTATPTAAPTQVPPTSTPSVPTGALALLAPRGDDASSGATSFEWTWSGPLPPELGFEVRVWREGDIPAGVHDAVLDNLEGRVQQVGDNSYRLAVDIADAPGVGRLSGQYLWTVVLVRVSPDYQDLGTRAEPATFRFESPGGG
jgi:hypothetical protein